MLYPGARDGDDGRAAAMALPNRRRLNEITAGDAVSRRRGDANAHHRRSNETL